jgi:hypothetical protein
MGERGQIMRVLVACEYSGIVRDAFAAKGHYAVSCDLLPTESEGLHYQGDVRDILYDKWDMMIAHPPCTYLAVSGARWFKYRQKEQKEALDFVRLLMNAPIDKICIENPVSVISTAIRKPDQIIHPYQFGHPESKRTCLWLKGLPLLVPTDIITDGIKQSIHRMPPGKNRSKDRSRTFTGIAKAMADQWS